MRIRHYHGGILSRFNPGVLRTANVVKALALAGHQVDLITADPQGTDLRHVAELVDLPPEVQIFCGGAAPRSGVLRKIPRRFRPSAVEPPGLPVPDRVILFDPNPATFRDVEHYCRQHGIPLVVDIDEWMGLADFSFTSWLTLFPAQYEMFMRSLPRKISYGLAIGEEMRAHLASDGAETLIVPPLHEHEPKKEAAAHSNSRVRRTRIVVPGRHKSRLAKDKESLDLTLSALERYPELKSLLEVDIVGGTDDPAVLEQLEALGETASIRNHGRLEWQQTVRLVGGADWLVALRDPSMRRLKYGFPSKVTEALVLGTPVIANDYSDMRTVLADPTLGYLVEELTTDGLADCLFAAAKHRRDRAEVARAAAGLFTPEGMSDSIDALLKKAQV